MARVFKAAYGVTPLSYLTTLRVEEMSRLIRETELLIGAIAKQVGWSDPDYSSAMFQKLVGVTPSMYRRYGPPTASPPVSVVEQSSTK